MKYKKTAALVAISIALFIGYQLGRPSTDVASLIPPSVQQTIVSARETITRFDSNNNQMLATIDKLDKELQASDSRLKDASTLITTLQARNKELEAQNTSLAAQVDSLKAATATARANIARSERVVSRLKQTTTRS